MGVPERQPFPRLYPIGPGWLDQQFWLPLLACAVTIVGLELLYRHTLIGRAFLAIARTATSARALGLPEQRLRMASYRPGRHDRHAGGLHRRRMLLAFFGNQAILNFYVSCRCAGRHGLQPRALIGGPGARLFQQAARTSWSAASSPRFAVFVVFNRPSLLLRPRASPARPRRVACDGRQAPSPYRFARPPPQSTREDRGRASLGGPGLWRASACRCSTIPTSA